MEDLSVFIVAQRLYTVFPLSVWRISQLEGIEDISENLPVVEFFVDEGISEEEAEILIESEPPLTQNPLNPFEKLVCHLIYLFHHFNIFRKEERRLV